MGHTGPEVHDGLKISKQTSRLLLAKDAAIAASAVDRMVSVPLTANQRIVLISFAFQYGATRLKTSTLLRLLNAGDYDAVPAQLARWNKETLPDGSVRVNKGLTNRREADIDLWNTP